MSSSTTPPGDDHRASSATPRSSASTPAGSLPSSSSGADHCPPDEHGPDQTGPDQPAPDQPAPDQTAPDQTGPDQSRPAPGDSRQDQLDRAFRQAFVNDERVRAALSYGSRPAGLGDAYSDVEFWAFVDDEAHATWRPEEWIVRAAGPPALLVENEFGAWVAIYADLVRMELHFWPASGIDVVRDWPARGAPVAAMVVVDRDSRLAVALATLPMLAPTPVTADRVAELCGRFANWWVLGHSVLARGELERAQDALSHVRRFLLWMARVDEGATEHWLTPSRRVEQDLSARLRADLAQTYVRTDTEALGAAFATAWRIGERLWRSLAAEWGFQAPPLLEVVHNRV